MLVPLAWPLLDAIRRTPVSTALNGVLGENGHDPVPMNRFRPNVVLDGPTAFAEHTAATVDGPGYSLRLAHPCQRCLVTTIDQATAERDPQRKPNHALVPLNPLAGHRIAPPDDQRGSLASRPGATIRVGDGVTLTGR